MAEQSKRKGGHHSKDASPSNKKAKLATKSSASAADENKSSSAQKRQLRKERQSHRRHAETVNDAKVLWNKLREKSNTQEKIKELMEQTMTLIRGKVNEIALQHDASRVVQAAIQFGNEEQRRELLKEICAESAAGLAELAKIRYAHFCCLKFIKYCARDNDSVKTIVKSFKGSIPKLAVHAVGARVVESLFLNLPPKATISLKQELYGPHFNLFSQNLKETPTLKSALESSMTQTQKDGATSFVKDIVTKAMTKNFYGYTFFQELCAEYFDVADPEEIRTIASNVADHSIHLLSTRAGTRVVAACATYATPKDRKRICKSLKGYTTSTLLHRDAYLALLQLVHVTDDTVSINKTILNEILTAPKEGESSPLLQLALSESASKLFLMVLVEDSDARMKYFDPYERTLLQSDATVKENGKEVPTSKKDPELRRQETLKNLGPSLEELCSKNASQLLTSLPGSRILKEVYNTYGSQSIVDAVMISCESRLDGGDGEDEVSIFEHPVGHRTIKNLVMCDVEKSEPKFAESLFERFAEKLMDIAKSNRGAFVVAALLKVPTLTAKVTKKLKPMKIQLKELSEGKGATAGFVALTKMLD